MGLDYDGTLAPIVDDPDRAYAHPDAMPAMAELAPHLLAIAVITGRPAAVAVELGGFGAAGGAPAGLRVLGQYGFEQWDAATGRVHTSPAPAGLEQARTRLPDVLAESGAREAYVEDKRIALGVHVRRLGDPAAAYERLHGPLAELAAECGLHLEPGRMVLELRPGGMDKGAALRGLVDDLHARCVVFAGDDLGDLAAFDAVEDLRGRGVDGLLVCSGSTEQSALAERADLVVDGPAGVIGLLRAVAAAL